MGPTWQQINQLMAATARHTEGAQEQLIDAFLDHGETEAAEHVRRLGSRALHVNSPVGDACQRIRKLFGKSAADLNTKLFDSGVRYRLALNESVRRK